MKKIVILILLALGLVVVGCGENGKDIVNEGKTDPLFKFLKSDNQEEKK